jgi:hypothetical protein
MVLGSGDGASCGCAWRGHLCVCLLLLSCMSYALHLTLGLCCLLPSWLQGYGNQRFVFQGVHETICYGPSDKPWADNEPRINQIVFIGRKLDRKALMEGFK